jgi:hypothetical protein
MDDAPQGDERVSDTEFKGYSLYKGSDEVSTLYVTRFRDRKLPSLAIQRGNAIVVLATFGNDESAQEFMHWMDCITLKEHPARKEIAP